jgi:hypothetical protein
LGSRSVQNGMKTSGKSAVWRDVYDSDVFDFSALQQRMDIIVIVGLGSQISEQVSHSLGVRPSPLRRLLSAAHSGRGNHGHGLGYLGRVLDTANTSPYFSYIRHC